MLERVAKIFQSWWNRYKFRSVPWVVMQFRPGDHHGDQCVNVSRNHDNPEKSEEAVDLKVQYISQKQDSIITAAQLQILLPQLFQEFERISTSLSGDAAVYQNSEVLFRVQGFALAKRPSLLGPDAGSGIFLSRGRASAGSVIALYPGTIYKPWEPLLIASIRNKYILRCKNGLLVDGKSEGISKQIFQSCAARDKFGLTMPCCDTTWLTSRLHNPLNVGQYVNNENKVYPNNVVYQECMLGPPSTGQPAKTDLLTLQPKFWKYLPNVWYDSSNNSGGLMIVTLVATKDIEEGEEILSSYHTVIRAD